MCFSVTAPSRRCCFSFGRWTRTGPTAPSCTHFPWRVATTTTSSAWLPLWTRTPGRAGCSFRGRCLRVGARVWIGGGGGGGRGGRVCVGGKGERRRPARSHAVCCVRMPRARRRNPNYEEPGLSKFWTLVMNVTDDGVPPRWVSFRVNLECVPAYILRKTPFPSAFVARASNTKQSHREPPPRHTHFAPVPSAVTRPPATPLTLCPPRQAHQPQRPTLLEQRPDVRRAGGHRAAHRGGVCVQCHRR